MKPPASAVNIAYLNHRGERSTRTIKPRVLRFGTSDYHPDEQWLLEAFDYGKDAERTFAMRDILAWDVGRA